MKILNTSIALLTFLLIFGCGTDDNSEPGTDTCIQGFDQAAMFDNIATQIIIPAYTDLQGKVNQMKEAGDIFVTDPNLANLDNLRNTFSTTYLSWQTAAPFEFGPAEQVFLRNSINNFPVNVGQLETNIANGNWDFDQPDDFDKGLPAIDYLLFGIAADEAQIIDRFSTAADAEKHRQYLTALIADIKSRVDQTTSGWESFKSTFVNNTGTADGTALSQIINSLNQNYELIKREKIGFPSGVLTSGFTNPEAVEAYYSGQSLALAKAAITATENYYKGGNGQGLDDYLSQVKATKGEQALDQLTTDQFTSIKTALDQLSDPLSQNIEDNPDAVTNAYQKISDQVVLLKTDIPSILCVSITYIDNPSDSD